MREGFLLVIAAICGAVSASARTWHVEPNGTGDAPTIKAAMDSATAGDTVQVACGLYREHEIPMTSGIVLRSANGDPECATLDGEYLGPVIECEHCTDCVIEGLTIFRGRGPRPPAMGPSGGGVHCDASSVQISSCIFKENRATYRGGGAHFYLGSTGVVEDCLFIDNSQLNAGSSLGGAGIGLSFSSSATVSRCRFTGNIAESSGGGLSCQSSSVIVEDCSFEGNVANGTGSWLAGGGGAAVINGSAAFRRSLLIENTSTRGGGICLGAASNTTIEECVLASNHTQGFALDMGGGGLYSFSSEAQVLGCTFVENTTIDRGAALYCTGPTSPTVVATILAFNEGSAAVFTYLASAPPTLSCCDLFGNEFGDWVGRIADQATLRGNFAADPLFCPSAATWSIQSGSPCAPPGITGCGLVGAVDVGCGAVAVTPTTWGRIKGAFRP